MIHCRRCGGEVVQKSLARLILVGVIILAFVGLALLWPILWLPALILALTGSYLILWTLIGRGRWCRNCKRFGGV
jgi:hypothetical protein